MHPFLVTFSRNLTGTKAAQATELMQMIVDVWPLFATRVQAALVVILIAR